MLAEFLDVHSSTSRGYELKQGIRWQTAVTHNSIQQAQAQLKKKYHMAQSLYHISFLRYFGVSEVATSFKTMFVDGALQFLPQHFHLP